MSDSVTNIQIEDVVSSVRRLVVDEKGPVSDVSDRDWPDTSERLILAPAWRVSDQCDPVATDASVRAGGDTEPDVPDQDIADETRTSGHPMNVVSDTDRDRTAPEFAEVFARLNSTDSLTEGADQTWPDDPGLSLTDTQVGTGSDSETPRQDRSPPWRDPESFLMKAAELAKQAKCAEGASCGIPDRLDETPAGDLNRPLPEPQAEPDGDMAPAGDAISAEPVVGDSTAPDTSQQIEIEALTAAMVQHHDQGVAPEHETTCDAVPDSEPSQGAPVSVPDVHDCEADVDPIPTFADDGPDMAVWDLTEKDIASDQDALRDMVAEVVRQELRGELGERITRNVRKLVRRELDRVLSAREWD
ncbi:hypothetical protein I5535_15380 [Rhodobacteraceae bacterium F11138]|nr:hypothetical protein [Rhodobacteraceae bacterium F11138]